MMRFAAPSGSHRMLTRAVLVIVALAILGTTALAQPALVTPDVPEDLPEGSATFFFPWNIVESDAGAYSLDGTLTSDVLSGIKIDAAWEIYNGLWILSVADATVLGGQTFRRSDVFSWNSTVNSFTLERSQEAAGFPDGSNLDAIFRDPATDDLVISFDAPTTLAGTTYQPADLIRYDLIANSFNGHFFDASVFGVPDGVNLTAAQGRGTPCYPKGSGCTLTIFSLDVPATIGGTTYLPGDLLSWDGSIISLHQSQSGWPISSRVNALSFRGLPGFTPPTMRIAKVDPATLRLSWSSTPCSGLENHGIYQGTIASVRTGVYDHESIDCTDSGTQLEEEIAMPGGSVYFLVVPNSQTEEGSYGTDSDGTQRPVGSSTCESIQNLGEC